MKPWSEFALQLRQRANDIDKFVEQKREIPFTGSAVQTYRAQAATLRDVADIAERLGALYDPPGLMPADAVDNSVDKSGKT